MYELNRVRLFCVGPRGARYTDVTLDLSGVGQIIAGQGSLFSTTVRRPSPYSLLLLENGGGKSVLLKLLFSVVLPGRRNAVGGSAAVMEKFVLGDDAAHVVLEWMHVRTGDRVITGKTLQRRRSGSAADRLAEHWWSLRPHHGVEIETLPFTADGRRLRLEGFREALQEIDRAAPITQLTWVGAEVGAWADHLRDTGIEPDLFGIQRRMNADEGDAASAFKFKSSREFVEWLLKIVLDAEDAVSVAGNFDSYARTVGDRHAMLLERDFAAGAVAALRPVADAHERHHAARTSRESAVHDGTALLLRVRARETAEAESTQRLRQLAKDAAATATAREGDRDRARDVVNETRRQTFVLERADAQEAHDQAKAGRDAADADLRGWALADLIERKTAAEQKSARLAEQITQAERDARPALDARDRAAGALLSKLHAEAAAARDERDRRNELAAAHLGNAAELDKEGRQALVEVERQRIEQKAIIKEVANSRAKVEAAVTAGLLAAGQGVAEAASEAQETARLVAERIKQGEQALEGAKSAVRDTAKAAQKTREALSVARGRHEDANRDLQAVLDPAARLTANELVQVALSTDAVDIDMLDDSADALAERLHDDDVERGLELDELRDAQREDQRLLDALGDAGLLPPRVEVEASLEALRAAGVGAHAGWRYLAENVPAAERGQVIEAHPQLADGVVIVDPAAMPAARQALNAARLLPAAAVAVGTGARMLTTLAEQPGFDPAEAVGEQFVVQPNPALFDAEAAEIKRGQLRETMELRGSEINSVTATLTSLREVQTELAAWRRRCPAGRLDELRETLTTRRQELADAESADGIAVAAAEAAATLCERIEDELRDLRPVERAAADRAGELDRLATAIAASEEQRKRLPEIDDAITLGERTAEELTQQRDRAQEQAIEAALAAENASARAERHRAEMGDVVTSTGEHAATVPADGIPTLRSAYQAAAAAYAAVEVGQDLRAAADTADSDAARLRADVNGHDPDDIARASELLRSPDGADATGRQAAIARTKRERTRCDEAMSAAKEKVGVVTGELKAVTPSDNRNVWIQLPEERRPTSVEHGRQLLTAAIVDQRAGQQRYEESFAEATRLQQRAGDAGEATRAFGAVGEPLAARLDQPDADLDTGSVEPYAGTSEQARIAAAAAQERLRETMAAERSAHQEVIRLVDVAVRLASEPKFEAMTNVARRALVGLDREQLAARADEFATQLEQRLATLTSDLDSASRHRKLIVDRLAALVDGALKTLRTASRLSKLPAGLGEWEGKEFLRIRFAEPDPSLLTARVGEVVDELSATATGRAGNAPAPKRDGLALLLRSIEAAVPKGFLVDLLKPDAVLRDERVPIENMNEVFSGGQELTAAIVLYCTMAALRANERGQIRARHSGVLFLDNPIGKASAEYLLELQQGVAAALGVQLVYTTGLSDDRALSAFPLWVRMRNDADLRAGLKHIRVAEVVRRQLPEPFPDNDLAPSGTALGTVTATRVYRRPV
ncbi:coiled-coil domain-containing protein [Plantactinospora endophytica]|uniref:Chromosome segregation ATPase n=1 Tax=Plantactinospora endophytica TaxID=673535 RepID=A0ABQ4EEM6_9ACTN|nr:hypothetical protein [Plantactinospora endophytica]GIG93175.1 hypothetical protein Pen02_81110 [Plantactinospora endophytica]